MAERAGISVDTVRAAERGAATVSVGTMFEVATLLGLDVLAGVARASLAGSTGATSPLGASSATARLTRAERQAIWRRLVLNPAIWYDDA